MLFSAEWIMFLGPTGFSSSRGKEVDSTEIKGAVGLKISDWLKMNYLFIYLLFFSSNFSMLL